MKIFLLFASFALPAFAVPGDYAEAMRVRKILEPVGRLREAAETIKLPVSRGFDQKGTSLCWAYATLSVLESSFLKRFPDSKLELSRRAVQVATMKDRYSRQIHGTENFISERGISIDAIALIREAGLVAFDDFTDIADPYGSHYDFKGSIAGAATLVDKFTALMKGLQQVYLEPPLKTHLFGNEVSRGELLKQVLHDQIWQSFAPATDGEEKFGRHPDVDARAGAVSWYMPREKFPARIRQSFDAGHAVEITVGGHTTMIYGGEYDEHGVAIKYFVKDSYPGYFYDADAPKLHGRLLEFTTAL